MTDPVLAWLFLLASELVAVVGAAAYAARTTARGRWIPFTVLAFALLSDVAIRTGQCAVLLGPATELPGASTICVASPASRPLSGGAWALGRVESCLVFGWAPILAAACWRAFRGRWYTGAAVTSWAVTQGYLVAFGPIGRERTQGVLLGWSALCLVAGAVAIVPTWARARTSVHYVTGALWGVECGVVVSGPFTVDAWSDWGVSATPMYTAGFAACALILWVSAIRRRT